MGPRTIKLVSTNPLPSSGNVFKPGPSAARYLFDGSYGCFPLFGDLLLFFLDHHLRNENNQSLLLLHCLAKQLIFPLLAITSSEFLCKAFCEVWTRLWLWYQHVAFGFLTLALFHFIQINCFCWRTYWATQLEQEDYCVRQPSQKGGCGRAWFRFMQGRRSLDAFLGC